MKADRSKHTILPLSKFGLMQVTRQRVRPETNIMTREVCPTCGGTGKIQASIIISDLIDENINYFFTKQNAKKLTISVHPYLYSYFTKGFMSRQVKWYFKYKKWVKLVEDTSLPITEYHFIDENGEQIQL